MIDREVQIDELKLVFDQLAPYSGAETGYKWELRVAAYATGSGTPLSAPVVLLPEPGSTGAPGEAAAALDATVRYALDFARRGTRPIIRNVPQTPLPEAARRVIEQVVMQLYAKSNVNG